MFSGTANSAEAGRRARNDARWDIATEKRRACEDDQAAGMIDY